VATFNTTSPVTLTSSIVQGKVKLYFNGVLLHATDIIEVDTSQPDVILEVSPPSDGYTLSGSTVGGTPAPRWSGAAGGGISGDFPTPSYNGTRWWLFMISASPNSPSLPSVEGFDPMMLIKKVASR
jgi:hypothetical protein